MQILQYRIAESEWKNLARNEWKTCNLKTYSISKYQMIFMSIKRNILLNRNRARETIIYTTLTSNCFSERSRIILTHLFHGKFSHNNVQGETSLLNFQFLSANFQRKHQLQVNWVFTQFATSVDSTNCQHCSCLCGQTASTISFVSRSSLSSP